MDGNLDREIFLRQEILLMYVEQNPINFFGQNRSEFFQRPWNIQDQAFIVLQLLQGLKIKRFTNFFGFNVFRETVHPHYNIKRLFLYFSIISPIIQFTLQALGGSPRLSFVNKCYGNDHKVFLIETSTLNILKRKFVEFDDARTDIEILQEAPVSMD